MTREHVPPAEAEVMAFLVQRRQATAREVREGLARWRPMQHGSVVTLLKRLEAKGLVARAKGDTGKAFVFRPARQASTSRRRLVRDFVQRIFHGDGVALVAQLFDGKPPSASELDQLQAMLDRMREQRAELEKGEA